MDERLNSVDTLSGCFLNDFTAKCSPEIRTEGNHTHKKKTASDVTAGKPRMVNGFEELHESDKRHTSDTNTVTNDQVCCFLCSNCNKKAENKFRRLQILYLNLIIIVIKPLDAPLSGSKKDDRNFVQE